MASIRISQLASVSAVTADDFLIVNDGDINTRKISYANFSAGLLSATAASQTITGSLTVTGTVAATDLNIDSGVLSVVSTTNKVGINVAGPAYDLDIAGDAQIRGGNRLLLADTTNVHTVSLQAPGTLTVSSAYTLPTAYPASNGMALVSTVAGAMDWAAILTDPLSGIGQMIVRNASNVTSPLSPGTLNQVLAIGADSVPHWVTAPSGFADPMTTAGDIIIRNASNVTSRLGIGTAGQTLVVSAGAPAWGTGAVVAGSNGQIQYNASGVLGANGNLNFDASTNTFETTNITATGNLSTSLVSSNLIPDTTGIKTLGSVASRWSALYVSAGLNFLSPDTTQTGQITYGNGGAYNFLGSPVGGGLAGKLNIYNGNNAHSVGLTVPAAINASYSLSLPLTDGTSGQALITNGSGALSFATVSGGGGSPGGADTQIQFNSSGSFSGNSNLTFTAGTNTLGATAISTTQLTVASTLNVLGNTTLGSANTNTITFTGRADSNLTPLTNNTRDLGSSLLKWNNIYVNLLHAGEITYPTADGTNGQVLTTDGSGTLSFTTVSGGGAVTSVNGDTGVVTVTPASISALALAGGTMTGNITFAAGQPTGTSATPGILSLIDNVDSSDQTVAGSAKAVKTAYDRGETGVTNAAAAQATADAALPLVGGTMTGNITFNGSQAFPAPLPGGSTTQVQFNNAGALDGSANLVLNGTVTTATALVAGGLTYPTADGTSGQVISTNGSGVLTFTTVSGGGGSPAGLDTQVQFNDGGSFGANANLVFNDTTNTLGVTAISALNITAAGTLNVLGGVTLGDANTDTITFTGRANSNLVPLTNNSVDLGGPSLKWNNAYINLLNAGGLVYPTADGAAGTVLTSDGSGTLSLAAIPTQTLAAVTGAGATTTTNISVGSLLTVQGDGASADGAIKLNCSQNSHGVTIQAPPHSAAATYTLTLPNNTGTNGQVLTTDGTGVLSFTTSASAPVTSVNTLTGAVVLTATDVSALSLSGGTLLGDLTMSGSNVIAFNATQTFPAPLPAGATTQVQFNNAGVLAGDAGLTYNATTDTLTTVNVAATDVTTATLTASGNAVLGDALTDTIALNGVISTDIVPNADDTRLLGSSTARWSQLWISDGIEFSADAADEARITPLATGLQGLKIGNVEIHAGTSANTNDESVFIGQGAGSTSSESRGVVVIGAQAGQNMVSGASNSVLIGYRAGKNINQSSNVVIGASAGFGTPTGTGQTSNVLVGYAAAIDLTEGNHNVAVGAQDLFRLVTGKGNVSIGFGSSSSIPNAGGGNVFIGAYNSAGTFSPTHSPGTGSVSNTVVMGSSGVTNAYIQVAWTAVSDARDKVVMGSVPHGLDFVSKLKPVTYQFKRNADRNEHNGNGQDRYGFLAQDVLALEGDRPVIIDNIDEDKLKLTSDAIIPVLVNAIKELKAEIEKLKNA